MRRTLRSLSLFVGEFMSCCLLTAVIMLTPVAGILGNLKDVRAKDGGK